MGSLHRCLIGTQTFLTLAHNENNKTSSGMKKETLDILDKVKNGELKKHEATEQLFVLFGVSGCFTPYILFDNPVGHWCATCKHRDNCSILNCR